MIQDIAESTALTPLASTPLFLEHRFEADGKLAATFISVFQMSDGSYLYGEPLEIIATKR